MISPQQPLLQSLSKLIAFQTIVSLGFLAGCSTNPNATSSQPTAEIPAVAQAPALRSPDVVYVPTPPEVVERMLAIANVKLRPQLLSQLKPGTRIVSHAFNMGDWKPDRTEQVQVNGGTSTIYFWTVPANPPANLRAVRVTRQAPVAARRT